MQREPLQPHVVLLERSEVNWLTGRVEKFNFVPPILFYASDPLVGAYLMEFHGVEEGKLMRVERVEN